MTMSNLIYLLTQPDLMAWLLKATALLVAALAATALLRRASAGTRHLVWLATLGGILLLPVVSMWAPVRLAIVPSTLIPSLSQIIAPPPPPQAAHIAAPSSRPPEDQQAAVVPAPSAPLVAGSTAAALAHEPAFAFWTTMLLL